MIHVRVQHHPDREHLLPGLLDKLEPLPTEVVAHSSRPPSPWAGYQQCMSGLPDTSHVLIIQDDAVPVPGFAEAVTQIGQTHPTVPVCLFLAQFPRDTKPRVEQAMKMGRRYVTLSWRSFLPVVATLWPRERLAEFAEWAAIHPRLPANHQPPRSDDAMAGRWKMINRQTVLACVPSIVEHPDEEPSLIGLGGRWGRNGRRAAFLAADARDYDWTAP